MSTMNDIPGEEWKPIPGFDGYEASSLGRIRSFLQAKKCGRVLRGSRHPVTRYLGVSVRGNDGRHRKVDIHRLVAMAFLGPLAKGQVVNHVDRCRTNNAVSNLDVTTQVANIAHSQILEAFRQIVREEIRLALADLLPRSSV